MLLTVDARQGTELYSGSCSSVNAAGIVIHRKHGIELFSDPIKHALYQITDELISLRPGRARQSTAA